LRSPKQQLAETEALDELVLGSEEWIEATYDISTNQENFSLI